MHLQSWQVRAGLMFAVSSLFACGGLGVDVGEPPSPQPEETGQTAQRLVTLVTCPVGVATNRFTPPLRNTPQDVVVSGSNELSNCYSVLGDPVTSASRPSFSALFPHYSCLSLVESGPSTAVFTWNTGETSTFTFTRLTTRVEGLLFVLTHVGTVSAGKFEGATAVRATSILATDLEACGSPEGLSEMTGATTLTLTKLL
ncbi:hypothetical protein ACN47A_32755 [Myxococcus fulvus]|uniref:hypothetical protein n=1 Tax=Myxococcus fulvus TaxID=33 RepID=UPI003B9AEEE2